MKGKRAPKTKAARLAPRFQRRRTVRLSEYEDERLKNQAAAAGLSVAEYIRRNLFGGRPIVARVDTMAISELRRLGGLLKHNFQTLRQAGASRELLQKHESLLAEVTQAVDRIGNTR